MKINFDDMSFEQLRSFILSDDNERANKAIALETLEERLFRTGQMSGR